MTVAAIVLAAGASRRLGQPKQLLRLGGETLLERALRLALEAGAEPVLVVLGAHFADICASVSFNKAVPVFNERWAQGISTSIHAGLRALDACAPQASAVLVMSCDQPRLAAVHLHALIGDFEAHAGPAIVASSYAGIHGVPAVFPRSVFAQLCALRGDKGARTLLAHPPCPVIPLAFGGGEVDIDLPADLAHLE